MKTWRSFSFSVILAQAVFIGFTSAGFANQAARISRTDFAAIPVAECARLLTPDGSWF